MNSAPSPSADELLARRPGVTPPSSQARSHSFLSDALVARGLISQEAVDAALAASRDGRRYTEILVDEGSIAEDDFARAMADHHGVDHVDLDLFDIDPLATALVSKDIARRNGALPIAVLVTGEVVVAIHDPALTNLVEIADVTGSRIRAVIASRSQIEGQLDGRPPAAAPVAEQAPVPVPEPAPLHAVVMQPVHEVQPEPEPPAPVVMTLPELSEPVPVPESEPEPATPASVADEPLAPSPAGDLAQRLDHAERAMREADERARLADYRAEGMAAAAQAASDALAQVSQACASAEEAARAGEQLAATLRSELAELRTQFDAERATRLRLEAELAGLRSAPVPAPIAPPPPPPVPSRPVLAAVPANLPVSPAQPAPPPRRASFSPPGAPPPTRPRPVESSKKRGLRRMIAALRRS